MRLTREHFAAICARDAAYTFAPGNTSNAGAAARDRRALLSEIDRLHVELAAAMTLPSWWEWQPADAFAAPLCSVEVVYDDRGECVASVVQYRHADGGTWEFTIGTGDLSIECAGHASMADAQRACERVYVTVIAALNGDDT